MTSITIPEGFSLVIAGVLSSAFVLVGQTAIVGKCRKAAKIPYPQAYAEKSEVENNPAAKKFNCAQRAHQNTLEAMPLFLLTSVISGLKYPYFTAGACLAFSIGRTAYTIGYLKGAAQRNHYGGIFGSIGILSLILSSTYATWTMVAKEFL